MPINDQTVLVDLEDVVYKLNLNSAEFQMFRDMASVLEGRRLNDGKCDPSGRLWVGAMHLQQLANKASLFVVNDSGNYETKIDSVTIYNGIVWTSDKKTMYYIDTPTSSIKSYEYDNKTGEIYNEKIAVQIPESLGFPDGMTIDNENMLWVGMWNGNAVICFNPNTGKVISKIIVPAHNVTSCAFGGENLDELFITTARVDMTEGELKQYPLAGSIFKFKTSVKGVKSNFYKENKPTK